MNELLKGLEAFGFSNVEEITNAVEKKEAEVKEQKPAESTVKIEDCIYNRNYVCPVCESKIKDMAVKSAKSRFVKTDTDLMPIYTPIMPFYYGVVLCSECGYAAVADTFGRMSNVQRTLINEHITSKFKPKKFSIPYTEQDVIEKYKMALLNCIVKKGKMSEKGYLCLAISWLYKILNDNENRLLFVTHSYESYVTAYQQDSFPFNGMDETVTAYLIGELARILDKDEEALKWASKVLLSRDTKPRIKDMARDIKENIKRKSMNKTAEN